MNLIASWCSAPALGCCLLLGGMGIPTTAGHGAILLQEDPPAEASGAENEEGSVSAEQDLEVTELRFKVEPISLDIAADIAKNSRFALADFFLRASRRMMRRNELEVLHINLSFDFMSRAVRLAPEKPRMWRELLSIAAAGDPDSERIQSAEATALERLSQLDPDDEVVRLRRLLWMIEQQPTAEARLDLFGQLLEPESVAVISEGVASRLALDMAQLLYRTGDTDGFAERLAQAVELAPSYPRATAMAAGYFGNTADPLSHAELLIAALVADPIAVGFGIELGELALENGAYAGASRMLSLARMTAEMGGSDSNALVTAQALALWGKGNTDKAIATIDARIRMFDQVAREMAIASDQNGDPAALGKVRAPIPPPLALAGGAIRSIGEDKKSYREFVQRSMQAIELLLDSTDLDTEEQTPESLSTKVAMLLDAAVFAAWQGEDAPVIQKIVDEIQSHVELPQETIMCFEAWTEIAEGREESAIAILDSIENKDDLAMLGLSLACERTDRKSRAAKIWFDLARNAPGTVMGIWCRDKLEQVLSTSIPPSQLAQDLDLLIKQIPNAIDRIAMDRGRAYSLRIEPVEASVGPFEPISYRVMITNRSGVPLTIGTDGPIRPTIGLKLSTTKSTSLGTEEVPWIVVPIDGQFEVQPRETYTIDIDLADYPFAEAVYANPDTGLSLAARVVSNYVSIGATLAPGPFGEKATSRMLRVDGVTADAPWRRDALDRVLALDDFKSVEDLALLLQVVTLYADRLGQEMSEYRDFIYKLFQAVYVELPAAARAWLVSVCPTDEIYAEGELYESIVDLFFTDEDPLVMSVILAKMTFQVGISGSRAPYFDVAEAAKDQEIADLASRLRQMWLIAEEDQATEDRQIK